MNFDFPKDLDSWHPSTTAPKDGTHILISQESRAFGVFYWENRASILGKSKNGEQMTPSWRGVYFISELDPMCDGSGRPQSDRFVVCHGLDEDFSWRPLPTRPVAHNPENYR